MRLGFGHFLCLLTLGSCASLALSFASVLHAALLQSGFSASILRTSPPNWDAIGDFVTQVPLRKLLFLFLTHSSAHVLVLLLLAANGLLLLAWAVQRIMFAGNVSSSELRVARENTLHFAVFRLIFLGSILESTSSVSSGAGGGNAAGVGAPVVPLAPGAGSLRELVCWLIWFGMMAFLRWFLVLLRERFQTAQSSPYATVQTFFKYLGLTVAFSVANLVVGAAVLLLLRPHTTWAVISLLLFENLILLASCLKIIFRYVLYIRTLQKEQPWEERGSALYYSDMLCELSVQVLTLAHLLHIWTCYGLSFSLIDLFLFLHVRQLLVGAWRNLLAMRNYSRALGALNARFPDASPEELRRQQDDVCSICRDSMEQAKKLPCGHLFHRTCLQQWIEHASFCPTCRAPLLLRGPAAAQGPRMGGAPAGAAPQQQAGALMQGMEAQNVVAQLHRLQQAHAAGLAIGLAGAGAGGAAAGGGAGNGYPGSSSSSIHSVGLRHRPHAVSASTSTSASASPAHLAASPSSILGISHSAAAPAAGVGAHSPRGSLGSPSFDMRHLSSWHSSQMASTGDSEASYRAALAEAEAASAAATGATVAASSPSASSGSEAKESTGDASSSSSSTLSLRERMYEATQRRLHGGQQQAARGVTSPASPTAASASSSDAAPSSSAAPSSPSVTTSASDVAASALASTPASSSSTAVAPVISSPPLLSQAEADANLARQLQEEEVLAAAEDQRRRGAGAFGRFFAAL